MQNLAIFLIRLQTFDLRIITKGELQNRIKEEEQKQAYSLVHETQYYNKPSNYSPNHSPFGIDPIFVDFYRPETDSNIDRKTKKPL